METDEKIIFHYNKISWEKRYRKTTLHTGNSSFKIFAVCSNVGFNIWLNLHLYKDWRLRNPAVIRATVHCRCWLLPWCTSPVMEKNAWHSTTSKIPVAHLYYLKRFRHLEWVLGSRDLVSDNLSHNDCQCKIIHELVWLILAISPCDCLT